MDSCVGQEVSSHIACEIGLRERSHLLVSKQKHYTFELYVVVVTPSQMFDGCQF